MALAESTSCVGVTDKPKFKSAELKMNLDGNGKPDVVAVFEMGGESLQGMCMRRALVFDAPEKITEVKPEQWLGPSEFTDHSLQAEKREIEKRSVGDRDLLFINEEIGGFQSHTYFSGEGGKLRKALAFGHPQFDGQFNETYDKKSQKLAVRIFDGGTLEVNGASIDLDHRAIKLRCRVRELHVQMVYGWDPKERAFKETDQGCVMGNAID